MPWDEKPRKVENTPEKIARISDALQRFSGRRFFPDTPQGIDAWIEAVADIVYDKPNGSLWNNKEIPVNPHTGPIDNDLDWLIKKAYQRFRHFPSPAELRAIYCKNFIPADGVMIAMEPEDV